jgi:hypothetical protein
MRATCWFGAIFPLGLTVAPSVLELLIAFLQAYVFAILTCIYLKDVIHPGHAGCLIERTRHLVDRPGRFIPMCT